MYALVVGGQILARGEIPGCARNLTTGAMVCPPNGVWTDAQAAACGWLPVTTVARPADTATQTSDYSVVLVSGMPTEQWTVRGKTVSETTADTRSANDTSLRGKAAGAKQANLTFLALAAPTNAQTLTQVQRLTRQVDALMAVTLDPTLLDDTTGT